LEDFEYSIYVQEYMKVFFQEINENGANSEKLKKKFDEIYWKCPELLMHIELNLRNIYLKYQQAIDKFYEIEKSNKLNQIKITPEEIKKMNINIKKQLIEVKENDVKRIQQEFLDGKLNVKNFADSKIRLNIQKILAENLIDEIYENKEIQENINKFLNSLIEYYYYMQFEFIINDIKKHYKEKENYKKIYDNTKKEIEKLEKNLKKLNKKVTRKGLFRIKNVSYKQTPEIKETIQKIKEKYKQLDKNKFYNKIYTELNNNSVLIFKNSLIIFCNVPSCAIVFNLLLISSCTSKLSK